MDREKQAGHCGMGQPLPLPRSVGWERTVIRQAWQGEFHLVLGGDQQVGALQVAVVDGGGAGVQVQHACG